MSLNATAPLRLLVCVGPRCDETGGGRALHAALAQALAEKFPDALSSGRVALQSRDCLRVCTRAQILRLEPSGEVFSDPAVEDLLRLVAVELQNDDPL